MTCYSDLAILDDFLGDENSMLHAVAWLGKDSEFATGQVSRQFFDRLSELAAIPWEPYVSMGFHVCELCQFQDYENTASGCRNLFIPFDGVLYVAPELILHYINSHHYAPPDIFIEAVMQCPDMRSMDYKKLLLKTRKRGLRPI